MEEELKLHCVTFMEQQRPLQAHAVIHSFERKNVAIFLQICLGIFCSVTKVVTLVGH